MFLVPTIDIILSFARSILPSLKMRIGASIQFRRFLG